MYAAADAVGRRVPDNAVTDGQTGAGKTYTMMGDMASGSMDGIVPTAADHIFSHIQYACFSPLLSCSV